MDYTTRQAIYSGHKTEHGRIACRRWQRYGHCNATHLRKEKDIAREARKTELVDMLAVAIHPEMRRTLQE